ncbi:hypothetical protein RQP46_001370 [Phenoliferia psychrophenolica]
MRQPQLGDAFKIIPWAHDSNRPTADVKWYDGHAAGRGDRSDPYYFLMAEGYNGEDCNRIGVIVQKEWRDALEKLGTLRNWLNLTIDRSFQYGSWREPSEGFLFFTTKKAGPPTWFLVYHDTNRNPLQQDFNGYGADTNLRKF